MNDSLLDRARANASEMEEGEWGYRVTLDPGAGWEGRWRGETSTTGEYGTQRVFLLWDKDGAFCFIYGAARLTRKVDAQLPARGDNVAIWRGDDEYANGRTIHKYGLVVEPSSEPEPEPPEVAPVPVQTQADFGDEAPW